MEHRDSSPGSPAQDPSEVEQTPPKKTIYETGEVETPRDDGTSEVEPPATSPEEGITRKPQVPTPPNEREREENEQLPLNDPGQGPWSLVAPEDTEKECGLHYQTLLQSAERAGKTLAIVRHGKLCFQWAEDEDDLEGQTMIHSVTKTLGAVVFGIAMGKSRETADPITLDSPADRWVTGLTPGAEVKHILTMTAKSPNLDQMKYDTVGTNQINKLGEIIEKTLDISAGELCERELFQKLGFENSSWDGKNFASFWKASLGDMARLGLLINNGGRWSGEQIVDRRYIYQMLHPQNPTANKGYGLLTWLMGADGWMSVSETMRGNKLNAQMDLCAPTALVGCSMERPCKNGSRILDVGVWYGAGTGGQMIVGHPGLDLVLVGKDFGTMGWEGPKNLWQIVRGALVASDPKYQGDENSFCRDYGANRYKNQIPNQ